MYSIVDEEYDVVLFKTSKEVVDYLYGYYNEDGKVFSTEYIKSVLTSKGSTMCVYTKTDDGEFITSWVYRVEKH